MNNKYLKETIYGKVKVVERQDCQYAVIDLEGNEIVPFGKYAWIDGFDHGLARVRIGHSQNTTHVFGPDGKEVPLWRKWGIINKQGIEVLPVIYDNIWNFLGKNRLSVRVESKELGNKDVYFHDLDSSIPYPPHYQKQKRKRPYNINDSYGSTYGEFEGSYAQDIMGYSDDVINDAFEGDPDNYWNID